MQRRDVAVPDGLLPASVGADALDGQIDLDEALGVGSHEDLQILGHLVFPIELCLIVVQIDPIVKVNFRISLLWASIAFFIEILIDLSTSR